MKKFTGILEKFRNKYFLATVFFLVWMFFFDPKDWGLILDRKQKLHELERSEQKLQAQIRDARAELHLLRTNAETIEKYAREKYMMKKDNEDLFIVNSP